MYDMENYNGYYDYDGYLHDNEKDTIRKEEDEQLIFIGDMDSFIDLSTENLN